MSFLLNCSLILSFILKCQADLNLINPLSKFLTPPVASLVKKPLGFIETAAKDGYKAEEHEVITEDGYILTLHRILPASNCTKKRPVFLMHGLFQTSDGFIDAGREAPGYVFSQECYDVWFGNFRGNYHSRKHEFLNPDTDLKFWHFDLDHMGKFDLPAMIDYVLHKTKSKKLIYVGFSQGGGTFVIMNSERPAYAAKVSLFVGLAPATRLLNTKSVQARALLLILSPLRTILEATGIWELLGKNTGIPISTLMDTLCQLDPSSILCNVESFVVDSPHPDSITAEIVKNLFRHAPAGSSVQTVAFYGQMVTDESFHKPDFGPVQNLKKYGTSEPPEYDLNAVQVPSIIYQGQSDLLVNPKDTEWLVSKLPKVLKYITVEDPLWNHLDMAYSRYWKKMIFEPLQKHLIEYSYDDNDDS